MMSELIVPQMYENKVLDENLKAFFKRYPYERSRLEFLLSQPVENQQAVSIELPAVPSKPPMRVLILAGIGSPLFLNSILLDKTLQDEMFQAFIVENNIQFLRYMFQYVNMSTVIPNTKIEWLFMHNSESIKPALFRVLKREHVASMMRSVYVLQTSVPQPEEVTKFYDQLTGIYDETVFHVMHNFGRIHDSLDGIRATLLNRHVILSNPGIEDLKDHFKGLPVLIVGAGPSLDRELKTIKENNDKFIIIAADAALKPLISQGIRVDYVTSIERLNDYQKPFFEGLDRTDTELVAFPVVHPDLFPLFPGDIRLVYRNYSYFSYFEKSWPKGIVKCGGSTSHLAIRLADWLGCNKAYLIGIDSCYEKQEGTDLYRSHCSGTGYEEWGTFVPLKDFCEVRKHLPPMEAVANDSSTVMTNMTYYQWGKEYSEELSEVCQRMTIINCNPKGLKFEGIEFKELSVVVSQLDSQEIKKPVRKAAHYYRTFNHKDIIQNFVSWKNLIQDALTETQELLKLSEVDKDRYEALIFVYNFRICVDPLFVAFIVQCCAKEFFELENNWWALNKAWHVDLKEKVEVTRQRLELFNDVVNQLLAIFEEGNKSGKK